MNLLSDSPGNHALRLKAAVLGVLLASLAIALDSPGVVQGYCNSTDGSAIPVLDGKLQALQRVLPLMRDH